MIKDYILIELACKLTGMTPKTITGTSNTTDCVNARLLCYYLLHKYALLNHIFIAELFWKKYTSVYQSLERIKSIDKKQMLSCENQKLIDLIERAEAAINKMYGMTG